MRGQEKMQGVKRGQTIVAERERAESDSERMLARKQLRRKRMRSVVSACLMLAILGLLTYLGARELVGFGQRSETDAVEEKKVTAEIVDESGRGQISARMKEYIIQIEEDFRALGYTVTRVTLPVATSRELYVDLAGETTYFKVSMDRGAAVTAEDAVRMMKYLRDKDLHPEYVDVRIDGKAYYK